MSENSLVLLEQVVLTADPLGDGTVNIPADIVDRAKQLLASRAQGASRSAVVVAPAVIGPALITGRPELVRLAAAGQAISPKDQQALVEFAEHVVRAVQAEREVYATIEHTVAEMGHQVRGMAAMLERLGAALTAARNGSDPEAVRVALRNPNRRDAEEAT